MNLNIKNMKRFELKSDKWRLMGRDHIEVMYNNRRRNEKIVAITCKKLEFIFLLVENSNRNYSKEVM